MRDLFTYKSENNFIVATLIGAIGAALYFILPFETPLFIAAIGIICAAMAFIFCHNTIVRMIMVFLFAFFYAGTYTHIINTPQITRNIRDATFTANVVAIDYTADKTRLGLRTGDINPNSAGKMTVRVNLGDDMITPNIGDTVRVTATLFRPNGQYAPETFDFARWAYFNGISATGYLTDLQIIDTHTIGTIVGLRDALHRRTDTFLADGLVFGYKRAVPNDDAKIWTTNGVGHVWSISGFHMTLVSGWLFAIFYMLLRCIPYITRRIPARIPATILAWFGLLMYLMISNAGAATIRAFLMITLVFAAFISGRVAISLRNVCLAMIAVLLINPHYVMQAGFQLSFAAVFGLVWFFGTYKMPENKILKIICAATLTSIIATLFTAPFVAAHFQALPLYSLVGNLILLPIFSFMIMPLVMIGVIAATIGWSGPIALAHWIYDIALNIAGWIAHLPMASIAIPHISNTAIMIFVLAFAVLILVKPVTRYTNLAGCALFVIAGIVWVACTPRPVVYATYDHELIAFKNADGILEFNKSRASNHYFAFGTWKQFNGDDPNTNNIRMKCERGVCRYNGKNFNFVYIQKFVPLAREIENLCRTDTTTYIASYFDVYAPNCAARILRGPFVIYNSGDVKQISHHRRWHNPRR